MNDRTAIESTTQPTAESGPCAKPFLLGELREGHEDKLRHKVIEIVWIGRNYAIYRTERGVYVQFSDNEAEEKDQRHRFTQITPELCELRYFTHEMHSRSRFLPKLQTSRDYPSPYEHNMAQAIMLVMEQQVESGKKIAQQALEMAVKRVTNDNTVRYILWCVISWLAFIIVGVVLYFVSSLEDLALYRGRDVWCHRRVAICSKSFRSL